MAERTREEFRLDDGWLFYLGDIDAPISNRHIAAYMANKAGWSRGAAKPSFDDSDWRSVNLPHDWAIEGDFSQTNHLSQGYLPRGVGWYRRHFTLEETDKSRHLSVRFDGVSTYCTVYVNGHLMHRNWCGYTSFTIDISDVAVFGEQMNTIAVRVDATQMEGWWYEGAGIYRHVWLTKTSKVRISHNGLFLRTTKESDTRWITEFETTVENHSDAPVTGELVAEAFPYHGTPARAQDAFATTRPSPVIQINASFELRPRERKSLTLRAHINNPNLWDLDSPSLYTARIQLQTKSGDRDQSTTTFGYRTIRFDRDAGFFLNDKHVFLKGTCNHQDHGGLGVALPDSIHEFRIARLKTMGCNAYRCAHNPPAPELLDACDRLGMLVMDENRNFGSTPEHFRQLDEMVLRDRNHPSVVLWSICNEESIQGSAVSKNIAQSMMERVKQLDPTRPVTAAISGGILNDGAMAEAVDIMSINYQLPMHDEYRKKHPTIPLVAGETNCAMSTRGQYATSGNYFDSYDTQFAMWGSTARDTWRFIRTRPQIGGMFVWTGFDYRGEPTPLEWPSVNSHWGIFDLCGFPKDSFYLHKAWWTSEPFVHILPHWTWPGREGETIRVVTHTNCDEVELFLNNKSLGRKKIDPVDMADWNVKYEPGTLLARGFKNSSATVEAKIETTGPAVALGLEIPVECCDTSRATIRANKQDSIPVTVFALDSNGRRVPNANSLVQFEMKHFGKIIGVGNGDPACHQSPKGSSISLFNGLAQVIVQASEWPGTLELVAHSDGLKPLQLTIQSLFVDNSNHLPPAPRKYFVTGWRRSAVFVDRPDPTQQISDQDMNSWERFDPGMQSLRQMNGFVLLRATINAPRSLQKTGGRVHIAATNGLKEVFLGNDRVAVEQNENNTVVIAFGPSPTPQQLTLLFQSDGQACGLRAPVLVTA